MGCLDVGAQVPSCRYCFCLRLLQRNVDGASIAINRSDVAAGFERHHAGWLHRNPFVARRRTTPTDLLYNITSQPNNPTGARLSSSILNSSSRFQSLKRVPPRFMRYGTASVESGLTLHIVFRDLRFDLRMRVEMDRDLAVRSTDVRGSEKAGANSAPRSDRRGARPLRRAYAPRLYCRR